MFHVCGTFSPLCLRSAVLPSAALLLEYSGFAFLLLSVNFIPSFLQDSLDFRESKEAEPHPLWEYPCRSLSDPQEVLTFDFTKAVPEHCLSTEGSVKLLRSVLSLQ